MGTASPPVSPSVVAAIFMIQKIKVTSGTLVNAVFAVSSMRLVFSLQSRGAVAAISLPGKEVAVVRWLSHPVAGAQYSDVTYIRARSCTNSKPVNSAIRATAVTVMLEIIKK